METLDQPQTAQIAPHAARQDVAASRDKALASREVLSFRLGAEEYGIDILRVQEIRSYEACTRIAHAPHFIKGILNLRGVIVPIVDLRLKFGQPDAALDGSTVTIVLNVAQRIVGVVVDSVSDVLQLMPDQIQAAPEFNASVDAGHILGIGTVQQGDMKRMLLLVDIEKLLAGADMGLMGAVSVH